VAQLLSDELPAVSDAPAPAPGPPPPRRRRNPVVAATLSILPGLGQVYNLHFRKALAFFLIWVFTIGPSVLLIMGGERFGHSLLEQKQFGLFLLVAFGSIIAFLVLFLLGLTFWAAAIVDARRSAKELSEGSPPTQTWWKLRL
jgi:arabinogalactan oligomer/maltooligosaccharide transport system permease protein